MSSSGILRRASRRRRTSRKSTARRLIGFVTEVSQDAVSKQTEYVINFDMEQHTVWASPQAAQKEETDEKKRKRFAIPESVKVVDVLGFRGQE